MPLVYRMLACNTLAFFFVAHHSINDVSAAASRYCKRCGSFWKRKSKSTLFCPYVDYPPFKKLRFSKSSDFRRPVFQWRNILERRESRNPSFISSIISTYVLVILLILISKTFINNIFYQTYYITSEVYRYLNYFYIIFFLRSACFSSHSSHMSVGKSTTVGSIY